MLQIYYPRLTCPDEGFIYSMLLSGSRCPRDLCVAQSGDEALTMDRIAAAERLERDRTRVVRGLSNESSLVVDHRFPGFPLLHLIGVLCSTHHNKTSHRARKGCLQVQ